ncbi:hypothetical protein DLM75_16480 [Leptospira stimsonii]|uniref:Uncharacterized protein n=2 Tax=Leptospira stimsonii TaxID=2202203 RepID=A0A396Z1L0_9LEPT|nr:hypothetical protein DLM75_16480 [Leptospira stimsonii]
MTYLVRLIKILNRSYDLEKEIKDIRSFLMNLQSKEIEDSVKLSLGKWYSWDTPTGLSIALLSFGVFLVLLTVVGYIGRSITLLH